MSNVGTGVAATPRMRVLAAACVLAVAAGSLPTGGADTSVPVHCGIEMRNVTLHTAEDVILHVRALDGEFVSRAPGQPPVFDDPQSYTLNLRKADVSMDTPSLNALLRRTLEARPAPIHDVTVTIADGLLQIKGKLQKGVSVPFSMKASVSATPEGLIRLQAAKLKAAGVPVKGLLGVLGLDVADLMKMPPGSGIRADGDDLLMDATALLPPPRMTGRVQTVAIAGNRLVMGLTGGATPPKRPATLPAPGTRNYLYFFGGSIRFGKLTMSDADMLLIDADPSTPFDFFPAHYEDQLVAGYSRNTRRKGLQVYMPDYSRVRGKRGMLAPPRLP